MAINPASEPFWYGKEWSINGEIRQSTAQEDLVLGFMFEIEIRSN
jgi:hypothetical protein